MATDFFERLAEIEVPPPPEQFDDQLHDRVNRSLVAGQLFDLVISGMPWALLQLARALVGFFTFTMTGRSETKTNHKRR
jgi:hypothetical protein